MGQVLITEKHLEDIADAIRGKNGLTTKYTPAQMATAITELPSGGSTTLKMGVLRPDATLVKTWSGDELAVTDLKLTLPEYNTTTQTVISAQPLNDDRYTMDVTNYDYYVIERMLTIPIYNTTTVAKGRFEYSFTSAITEIINLPGSSFKSIQGDKYYTSANLGYFSANESRSIYWSSATAIGMVINASYGTSQGFSAPTAAAGVITPILPSLTMRGHTSYFTSTYWSACTDIRRQYIIEVYRAPKGNLNIDGWGIGQQLYRIRDCVNASNHKLT